VTGANGGGGGVVVEGGVVGGAGVWSARAIQSVRLRLGLPMAVRSTEASRDVSGILRMGIPRRSRSWCCLSESHASLAKVV